MVEVCVAVSCARATVLQLRQILAKIWWFDMVSYVRSRNVPCRIVESIRLNKEATMREVLLGASDNSPSSANPGILTCFKVLRTNVPKPSSVQLAFPSGKLASTIATRLPGNTRESSRRIVYRRRRLCVVALSTGLRLYSLTACPLQDSLRRPRWLSLTRMFCSVMPWV